MRNWGKANGMYAILFCLVVAGGGLGAFVLAHAGNQPARTEQKPGLVSPAESGNYFFGNGAKGFSGWEMPADTLVFTPFKVNQTLNNFVVTSFILFPYSYGPNTTLYLGLYVNGKLVHSSTSDLSHSHAMPASIVGQPMNTSSGAVANFTAAVDTYGVSDFPLTNPIPAGAIITVSAYVTSPVWVQRADSGSSSYEATGTAAVPSTLPTPSGSSALPILLCVSGESQR